MYQQNHEPGTELCSYVNQNANQQVAYPVSNQYAQSAYNPYSQVAPTLTPEQAATVYNQHLNNAINLEYQRAKNHGDEVHYENRLVIKRRAETLSRELRRNEHQEIVVTDKGEIIAITKGTTEKFSGRNAAGFRHKGLKLYRNMEDKDNPERIACLTIFFAEVGFTKSIYLLYSKMHNRSYIRKKLMEVGAVFNKYSARELDTHLDLYAAYLLANAGNPIEVPAGEGWYYDSDGNLHYAKEEDITWEWLMNKLC